MRLEEVDVSDTLVYIAIIDNRSCHMLEVDLQVHQTIRVDVYAPWFMIHLVSSIHHFL